jgi:hypothetical protein
VISHQTAKMPPENQFAKKKGLDSSAHQDVPALAAQIALSLTAEPNPDFTLRNAPQQEFSSKF